MRVAEVVKLITTTPSPSCLAMPRKDPVARAEYGRQYHAANREAIRERERQYRAENREERLEKQRQYQAAHREEIAEWQRQYQRQYRATPEGKKAYIINGWKQSGLICDDYYALYADYLACEQCMDCGKPFTGVLGDGSGAYRQMDHDHATGAFRAFVCPACNTRRGYEDAAAAE